MKRFTFLLLLPLALTVSCKKHKLLKDADGSYQREASIPMQYTDSTSQALYEALIVSIDRKDKTFKWDGYVVGKADVEYTKSDRSKSELEVVFKNKAVYEDMIPAAANASAALNQAKFYIRPNGRLLELSVIVGGVETIYYYSEI